MVKQKPSKNAEAQAAYRARQREGNCCITVWISPRAKSALTQAARICNRSEREALEQLIIVGAEMLQAGEGK